MDEVAAPPAQRLQQQGVPSPHIYSRPFGDGVREAQGMSPQDSTAALAEAAAVAGGQERTRQEEAREMESLRRRCGQQAQARGYS